MAKKKDELMEEAEKIKAELEELKKQKKKLDKQKSKTKPTKDKKVESEKPAKEKKSVEKQPKPEKIKPKKSEAKPVKTKLVAKTKETKSVKESKPSKVKKQVPEKVEKTKAKQKEDMQQESEKTLEEELEEQLSDEEIENFQIEKVDMEKLTNRVCDILAEKESDGMFQSELWKKLKLTSRDGSRLALKLERMGIINREKILEKGRWTYKLILKKTPISTLSIENAPCLVCPVEQKCSLDGEISPRNCIYIEEWVLDGLKKPMKVQ